ncbi:CCA tRNA nucleotidyltransferase 1, mitochondrial isoform X2 [Orussus abietinus]|uniref:CCA tRNA nucleotidyltransferase 1, mitochondrial isoform X2 n=1 Tax=Orussus abietinus TaxID=222816 RepID=UPI00062635ED|nr:CCA tRNA nucleotidyltransferase 1, mitochondrial isoform X2 [Orussus abietinus]
MMVITLVSLGKIKFLFSRVSSFHVRFLTQLERQERIEMATKKLPRYREDPVIMKLDTPEFHSIFTPELNILSDLFKKYNFEIRIAGGAVRDMLMGMMPKDIDFATTATPDQMKDMFTKENIRMINMNGEKHGTVTSRINNKENFEITTLRIDVVTYGRRADVEFTTDWRLDANRRDLTINSMFLDLDGHVYDYFFGYEDLQKRRIAFVGDASTRIQEDYLRILRVANDSNSHEDATIKAIKENVEGMSNISGERIWSEWSKILEGRFAGELMIKMIECDMAKYIGLPANLDLRSFKNVYSRAMNNGLKLKPIVLITSMLKDEGEVMNLHQRLKLSAYDRDLALFIVHNRHDRPCENPLKPYQHLTLIFKGKVQDSKTFVSEVLKYRGDVNLLNEFEKWDIPRFPINGHMLKPLVPHGKMIGPVMTALKAIWLEHNFQIPPEKLLTFVPNIIAELKEKKK